MMEIINLEEKFTGVQLQERWQEWPSKHPVAFALLLVMFLLLPIVSMFLLFTDGEVTLGLLIFALPFCFFLLINLATIIKMFKPAEYLVKIQEGTLTVSRNKEEKFSIALQDIKKIVFFRHAGTITGVTIYKEAPDIFYSGKGYNLPLAYIPQKEIEELAGLLQRCRF